MFLTETVFLTVVEVLKSALSDSEMNEMLEHIDEDNSNVLHHAAANDKHEGVAALVANKTIELVGAEKSKSMMKLKDNESNSPLQVLLRNNQTQKSVDEFLKNMQQVLDRYEMKQMLMEKESQFGLSCFLLVSQCKTSECIVTFWRFAKSVMDENELRIFLKLTDNYKRNALQVAAEFNTSEVFLKVVEVLKEALNDSEVNEMLEHVNNNSWNVFHHAAANEEHEGVAALVIAKTIKIVGAEKSRSMMKQKNEDGNNPLFFILHYEKILKHVTSFISSIKSEASLERGRLLEISA
jgi:hypothetical protein